MKVTNREKTVLLILVAGLVLVLMYFILIKPTRENIDSVKAEKATAQQLKNENDDNISKIPGVKSQIEKKKKSAESLGDTFLPFMESSDLDTFIQSYLDKNGVVFSDIKIEDRALTDLAPYSGSTTYDPGLVPEKASDENSKSDDSSKKDDTSKTDDSSKKDDTSKTDDSSKKDEVTNDNKSSSTTPASTSSNNKDDKKGANMMPAYSVEINFRAYTAGIESLLTDFCQAKNMSIVVDEVKWNSEVDITRLPKFDENGMATYPPIQPGIIAGSMTLTVYYTIPVSTSIK